MRSLNPWPVLPSNLDPPIARSLSLQFIIQALLDGFTILLKLQTASPLKWVNLQEEMKVITKELEKIFLFSLENPMSQKGGVIDKLCFYSEVLMKTSQVKEPELILVLEEMRKSILFSKTKMVVWKKMPESYSLEEMLGHLMQLYSSLFQQFRLFFSSLVPFLYEARSNENVLIYLIENKEKLNEHLGTRFIEEMLQSFFPAGFDQLRVIIHEGFSRRGFQEFLSKVEPLIENIQWETPCLQDPQ